MSNNSLSLSLHFLEGIASTFFASGEELNHVYSKVNFVLFNRDFLKVQRIVNAAISYSFVPEAGKIE